MERIFDIDDEYVYFVIKHKIIVDPFGNIQRCDVVYHGLDVKGAPYVGVRTPFGHNGEMIFSLKSGRDYLPTTKKQAR